MKRSSIIALNLFGSFSPNDVEILMNLNFNPENPNLPFNETRLNEKIKRKVIKYMEKFDERRFKMEMDRILSEDMDILTYWDEDYPPLLREIPSPPILLYIKGDRKILKSDLCISIVGSRKPTPYGLSVARRIASELCNMGFVIISGMAMGIDVTAQMATVKAGGKSIGVLGTGVDVIYPKSNFKAYSMILESGGTLISEYPLGTPPLKQNFPRRNRIIAGLSLGTLVVEAGEKSGSLITAMLALEYDRMIFSIPGPITSPLSIGTNKLIQMGAKLVVNVEDVIDEFPYVKREYQKAQTYLNLSKEEEEIMEKIKEGYDDIDSLTEVTQKDYFSLISIISNLELKGALKGEGGRYIPLI